MNRPTEYSGATILVTGGAGAIGSCLTRQLTLSDARKIVVVDDMSSGYRWNVPSHPAVKVIEASILDDSLYVQLQRHSFDYVFHLAALFANQNSIDHPQLDLSVNGMGTLRMLELARDQHVRRFVYASSSSSFSKANAPLPLTEDFLSLKLDTPYQITKLLGEYYCNFFQQHWEVPTVRLRLFNSYGPGEVPGGYRNVIPNFMNLALHGKALPITGTGEETRDFTFIEDIVQGMLLAGCSSAANGDVYNLASGRETRVIDLANAINTLTGNRAGVVFRERRNWDHTSRRWASVDKARRDLGYEPQTALNTGLTHTLEWFRNHWSLIQAANFAPTRAIPETVLARAA
jgi:UDP-glucose 4-epimerase